MTFSVSTNAWIKETILLRIVPPRNAPEYLPCSTLWRGSPGSCPWQPTSTHNWICDLVQNCDSLGNSGISKYLAVWVCYFSKYFNSLILFTLRSRITGLTHSVFCPREITSRSQGEKQRRQYLVWSLLWSFHQLWFTGVLGIMRNIWRWIYHKQNFRTHLYSVLSPSNHYFLREIGGIFL